MPTQDPRRRCSRTAPGITLTAALLASTAIAGAGVHAQDAEAPVSFTFWATPTFVDVPGYATETAVAGGWEALMAQRFMAEHPNVTIDVQSVPYTDAQTKMVAAVVAGTPPDLYWDADTRQTQWAAQGLVEDMRTLVPDVWERIDPSIQSVLTVADVAYGIPAYVSPGNFIKVNRAIFEEAGATIPADGTWTYPEFEAALTAIAKPGERWPVAVRMSNEQADYDWFGYLWGFGCDAFTADLSASNMSSPECVQGIEWLASAAANGWLIPGTTTIQPADIDTAYYGTGQTAVAYGRSDIANRESTLASEGKIQTAVESELVLFPHAEGVDPRGLITFLASYQVFKQDDPAKREAIAEFVRFLAQPDQLTPVLQDGGSLSPFTDVATPGTDPAFLKVADWYERYGVFDWGASIPVFNEIRIARIPALQAAILGEISAQEAAAQIDEMVNAILQDR